MLVHKIIFIFSFDVELSKVTPNVLVQNMLWVWNVCLPGKYTKEWNYCVGEWYNWVNEAISLLWVYFGSITAIGDDNRKSQSSFLSHSFTNWLWLNILLFLTEAGPIF